MRLSKLYELAIKYGIEQDPRGNNLVDNELIRKKEEYTNLKADAKKEFDLESLTNPYADTRILYGEPDKQVKKILVGIDIDVAEILLADRLNRANKKIDLVISHHPQGAAWAGFYDVMKIHVDILNSVGVPVNVAEDLTRERMQEVERKVLPANHNRAVDAASLLDIPFMCLHTPADNQVCKYLQKLIDNKRPYLLGDILTILKQIPEYKEAILQKTGPRIIWGDINKRAGKVLVEMTGGTEGSKDIFSKLSQAGVGTLVSMHLSEEHFKKAKDEHINIVIAGHIASDSLGLNLLLDKLLKHEKLDIISCSGFRRIKR